MKNPKTKAILEQVRILAQTYPDFVYREEVCKYNSGGDSKYPDLCGCIIGQAARKAGIDTSDWDVPSGNYGLTGISFRVVDRLNEYRCKEVEILTKIQDYQDQRIPWGESYVKAMEYNNGQS